MTETELEKAKHGYLERQHVARTDDGELAATLAEGLFLDRTMAYYADLEKKIATLTPPQVLEALKKHIDPKRLVVVDAGEFKLENAKAK